MDDIRAGIEEARDEYPREATVLEHLLQEFDYEAMLKALQGPGEGGDG